MAKPRENPALLQDDRLKGSPLLDDAVAVPTNGKRASDRTNIHDAGSDANDTPDGLTESEEAVRQAAEETTTGQDPAELEESVPVFDRGSRSSKS